jgi:hypothetical protein
VSKLGVAVRWFSYYYSSPVVVMAAYVSRRGEFDRTAVVGAVRSSSRRAYRHPVVAWRLRVRGWGACVMRCQRW